MQAIVGDILRALEADGIYQATPAGLPCSIVFVSALGDWINLSRRRRVNPVITYMHYMTDVAMLSLLQQWPETMWKDYLRRAIRGVCLTHQASVAVHAYDINKPSEYLHKRYQFFTTARGEALEVENNIRFSHTVRDGEPDALQCCGYYWDYNWQS